MKACLHVIILCKRTRCHRKEMELDRMELDRIFTAIKTRFIVTSCGGSTNRISQFFHHPLSLLLAYVPAHLKNVQQFLERLKQFNINGEERLSSKLQCGCTIYEHWHSNSCWSLCLAFAAASQEHSAVWVRSRRNWGTSAKRGRCEHIPLSCYTSK